jgi:hypothetical protein
MNALDIVIGVVVVGAVVFFGALISAGNERLRKASLELNKIADGYFTQRLRLARGQAQMNVSIPNHAAWLSEAFSKAYGEEKSLTKGKYHKDPECLEMLDVNGRPVLFTPLPPDHLARMIKNQKRGKQALGQDNPLLKIGRDAIVNELNILNTTPLFDLELPVAWKELTGQPTTAEKLWAYSAF